MCRVAGRHIAARELLTEHHLLGGMCADAKRLAVLQLTTLATAIVASMDVAVANPRTPAISALVDAGAIAKMLNVAPSKIATDARGGKIPSVRVGRYVRFDPGAVEAAYARTGRT